MPRWLQSNQPLLSSSAMTRRDDNIQMYWPHALATLLFAIAVARYVSVGRYESFARSMAAAFFGFVCVVASHEVADWTGWFGWSYDSFWTYPPNWVRWAGLVLLAYIAVFGFR